MIHEESEDMYFRVSQFDARASPQIFKLCKIVKQGGLVKLNKSNFINVNDKINDYLVKGIKLNGQEVEPIQLAHVS